MKGLTVYRSSAGSGKTYTLVKTYLSLLFRIKNDYGFKQILGITFTNKAADEMKSRVFSALEKINEEGINNELALEIARENNFVLSEIVERSRNIYDKILHNYGDFNLMTIDKFTNQVIRSFSNELGLASTYEVILEEQEFLEQSISEFIDQTATDNYQLELIQKFIDESIRQGAQNDIEKQLKRLKIIIFQSDQKAVNQVGQKELIYLRNHVVREIGNSEKKIKTLSSSGLAILISNGIDVSWQPYGRLNKVFKAINELKGISYDAVEKWSSYNEKKQWFKKNLKTNELLIIESVESKLNDIISEVLSLYYYWLKLIEVHKFITSFSMVQSLVEKINQKKNNQNSIFISDFNFLVSDIIKQEPPGFIFEKIGSRYQYILVDEFQDTSKMQWDNLIPLVHESLSNGGKNLIVGDAKQSIYRWRNGNVKQFLDLPHLSDEYLKNNYELLIEQSTNIEVLEDNWRSSVNIVEFNNWLFSQLSSLTLNNDVFKAYNDVSQNIKRDYKGSVYLKIKSKGDFDLNQFLDNKIKSSILIGYNFSDIVLLTRSKKDSLKIIRALEELNFPFKSEDSIFLISSCVYKLLYYGLSYFEFKRENDFKLLIHFLTIYFKDELGFLDQIKANILSFDFEYYNTINDFQKLYYAVSLFRLSSQDPYVDVFVNSGVKKIKEDFVNIGEMLNFFDEKASKIVVETGSVNAVQIMTIHKSKGLEFPIVIIPFASWANRNNSNPPFVWLNNINIGQLEIPHFMGELSKKSLYALGKSEVFEKEEYSLVLDNLNLLYVSFTRASDHLHVGLDDTKSIKSVTDLLVSCIKTHPLYDDQLNELSIDEGSTNRENILSNDEDITNNLPLINPIYETVKIQDFYSFGDKVNLGTIFHDAISKVSNDFSKAYYFLSQLSLKDQISELVFNQCHDLIQKIESSTKFDFIYNNYDHIYNEREIIDQNGELIRLDRLIIKNKKAVVIDYKTSSEKTPNHKDQVLNYVRALEHSNFVEVSGYLLYVSDLDLVKVI